VNASHVCVIEYEPDWRLPIWDLDVPSRPGWRVICPSCGQLGPAGWHYAAIGTARQTATRHLNERRRKMGARP
jgi:hypothetical protein